VAAIENRAYVASSDGCLKARVGDFSCPADVQHFESHLDERKLLIKEHTEQPRVQFLQSRPLKSSSTLKGWFDGSALEAKATAARQTGRGDGFPERRASAIKRMG
jgi:hypothetical protein